MTRSKSDIDPKVMIRQALDEFSAMIVSDYFDVEEEEEEVGVLVLLTIIIENSVCERRIEDLAASERPSAR